jgi:hypothetical protein
VFVAWLQLIAVLRKRQVLPNGPRLDLARIFISLHCTNETTTLPDALLRQEVTTMLRILMTILLWAGLATASYADDVPADDASEFQRIITSQIDAFKADDGAKAYSFAAPSIQMIYPSSETFMKMVQQGYPQVYRPKSYKFIGAMLDTAGRPAQKVLFIGPDGKAYSALYTMQKQPDGTWKIAGCLIVREEGQDA